MGVAGAKAALVLEGFGGERVRGYEASGFGDFLLGARVGRNLDRGAVSGRDGMRNLVLPIGQEIRARKDAHEGFRRRPIEAFFVLRDEGRGIVHTFCPCPTGVGIFM